MQEVAGQEQNSAAGGGFDLFGMFGLGGGAAQDSADDTAPKGKGGRGAVGAKLSQARKRVDRLLSTADVLVKQFVSDAAAIRPGERELITEPLAEMVAESKELAKIAGLTNSFSLTVGLLSWSYHIFAAWQAKHAEAAGAEEYAAVAPPGATTAPYTNGAHDTEDYTKPKVSFIPMAPEMFENYAPVPNTPQVVEGADGGNG